MKKLIWLIILVAIIAGAVLLLRGNEDSWVKDSDGRWVRRGNPSLPVPEDVLRDCFEQNSNRAFDFAVIACREDLCGIDTVCARSLEREFERMNGLKPADQANNNTNVAENAPQTNTNQTTKPSNANTDNPAVNAPVNENMNANVPAANANIETPTNSNTNSAPTPPAPQSSLITIAEPASGSSVHSPLVITGTVKASAGDPITIQISSASGAVLISETAKLKNVDPKTGWGTYKITITYEFSNTREGNVVVFDSVDPEERVTVPLIFN